MTQLGIKQYFNDIVKGGFGSDHEQRSVLVSIAHERTTENGFKVNKRFHFGDTQNDITAAETSGVSINTHASDSIYRVGTLSVQSSTIL